jgi:hypothetical protein
MTTVQKLYEDAFHAGKEVQTKDPISAKGLLTFHTFQEKRPRKATHFAHIDGSVLPIMLKREMGKYLLILLKVMTVICRSIN